MRITALFTAAGVVLAAGPALAADIGTGPASGQVTVRLSDLDLATPVGAHAAIARLARAAAMACSDGASPNLLRLSYVYQHCRAATLEAAAAQIRTSAAAAAFAEVHRGAVRVAKR